MTIRKILLALVLAFVPASALAQHGGEGAVEAHGDVSVGADDHAEAGHGDAEHGEEGGHGAHATYDNGFSFSQLTHMESFGELKGAFVNFILLMLIFGWVIKNKVNPGLAENRKQMEEALAEAARLKAAAEAKAAELQAKLDKLDSEREDLRAEMVKAGETERDRIIAEAEQKSARVRKDTQFVIEQRMKQLREDLTREAATAAVAAAEAVLRDKAGPADQTRLAEDYLAQLGELANNQETAA